MRRSFTIGWMLFGLALPLPAHAQGQQPPEPPPAVPAADPPRPTAAAPASRARITTLDMLITDDVRKAIGDAKSLDDPIVRGRVEKSLRGLRGRKLDVQVPIGEADIATGGGSHAAWMCSFDFYARVEGLEQRVRVNEHEMPVVIASELNRHSLQQRPDANWMTLSTDDEEIATWVSKLKFGDPVRLQASIKNAAVVHVPRFANIHDRPRDDSRAWTIVVEIDDQDSRVSRPAVEPPPAPTAPRDDEAETEVKQSGGS